MYCTLKYNTIQYSTVQYSRIQWCVLSVSNKQWNHCYFIIKYYTVNEFPFMTALMISNESALLHHSIRFQNLDHMIIVHATILTSLSTKKFSSFETYCIPEISQINITTINIMWMDFRISELWFAQWLGCIAYVNIKSPYSTVITQ